MKDTQGAVLALYGSQSCGPCKIVKQRLDAAERDGLLFANYSMIDVGTEEGAKKANDNGVMSIPTVVLYVDGVEKWRKNGIPDISEINEKTTAMHAAARRM